MNFISTSKHTVVLFIVILFGIFLTTCGRKQKNIFSFSNENIPVINKLSLPVVRGIIIKNINAGLLISWVAPDLSKLISESSLEQNKYLSDCFVGFNIYRLVRKNIIPKHPINKKPITKSEYIDSKASKEKSNFYLIKIVFSINQQIIEGPASAIACI